MAIGIDVGGTKVLATLVDAEGTIRHEIRRPSTHDDEGGAGAALANLLASIIVETCDVHQLDVATTPVGIGLPGLVRRDGTLAYAPNLATSSGANFPALLADRIGSTIVTVENDGNAAAVAEHAWGTGHGATEFAMITLGTGIGGGLIANGELIRGRQGFGGEIGHMIVQAGGVPCNCGRLGCWERYASGTGLGLLATRAAHEGRLPTLVAQLGGAAAIRAEHITAGALEGLEEATAVMDELAWWLAIGLSNLVEIFDIGHFVIGGGLATASEALVPQAATMLVQQVMAGDVYRPFTVEASALGSRAGALGAALIAQRRGT